MNTENIKLFLSVVELGSFANAAKQFNIATSSVSRAINALEHEIGVQLFHRTTRKIALTQAGDKFHKNILPVQEAMDLTIAELVEDANLITGTLRIAASVSFGQAVLPKIVSAFTAVHSDLVIDLQLSDRRVDLIEEGIDVAIRHGKLEDSSLIARKLRNVCYHLVAAPEYLERAGIPKSISDLKAMDLMSFSYSSFARKWRFRQGNEMQEMSIMPKFLTSNAMMLKQCALNAMGITLLADWTLETELEKGNLVEVLPDWEVAGEDFETAIWIVYPSAQFVPSRTRAFVDFMVS